MRLFIASPVRLYRYEALRKAFSPFIAGKWVETHNLHLTWIFLGDTHAIKEAVAKLRNTPLLLKEPLVLRGTETFGEPPRILYAKSDAPPLYAQAEALQTAGFRFTRFSPHVTLCRIKAIRDANALKSAHKRFETTLLGEIAPRITLYKSTLTPQGPHYTPLFTLQAP
jgi:2'-5' RNA ligase